VTFAMSLQQPSAAVSREIGEVAEKCGSGDDSRGGSSGDSRRSSGTGGSGRKQPIKMSAVMVGKRVG
jgi:hypothetical protein